MIDSFIDNLVLDLKPIAPLKNRNLFGICIAGFIGILAFVLVKMGARSDFSLVLKNGILFWKNGGLLLSAIGALAILIAISRPYGRVKLWHFVPALGILAIVFWQFYAQIPLKEFIGEVLHTNFGGAASCLSIIAFGGLLCLGIIWQLWLKKTATNRPILLGFAAGVLSGSLAAFAYSFHCNMDGAIYYLVCYWLPILALGGIGGIIGLRLKW